MLETKKVRLEDNDITLVANKAVVLDTGTRASIAPMGLAYGVTNQILSLLPNISQDYFEGGLPPNIFANTEILRIF